ncbi:hypothetical protein BACI349Y_20048 [Bacillus sp. 349Y]|nr:hypothetical protein BACI349Y_20048 [Bacillus sp. 349Y]
MQRRVADSRGNRGKVETLQAQPKRLNSLPAGKRPPAEERNVHVQIRSQNKMKCCYD